MKPRECWYRPSSTVNAWRAGRLLAFSPYSDGNGLIRPVGILEDDKTSTLKTIYVEDITFAAIAPGEIDRT